MNRRLTLLSVTLLAGCTFGTAPDAPVPEVISVWAVGTTTVSQDEDVPDARMPGYGAGPEAVRAIGLDDLPHGLAWGADSTPRAVLRLAPYIGRLRTVEVAVGGEALPFLLDTGGGVTLLTPETAGVLGCSPFGRLVGFRHNGDPVSLERCPPVSLRLDGWATAPGEVGVFDLMGLLPDGLPTLGGLLALDTFDGRAVTLILGADSVVIESRGSLARRIEGAAEIRMREAHQASGASLDVFLAVEAASGPLWFELDSGNSGPVLLAPHAAEALGLDLSATEPRAVTLELGGYGPVSVDAMVQPELVYDGLLNAAFLETVTLTLDLLHERAWVR